MAEAQEVKAYDGDDIVALVDDKVNLHATNHTLNVNLATNERRTKHTRGVERKPGDVDWSINVDALVAVKPDTGDFCDSFDMLDLLLSKKEIPIVFVSTYSEDGTPIRYTGRAIVTSYTNNAQTGEDATYSATLTGSGDLVKEPETPTP